MNGLNPESQMLRQALGQTVRQAHGPEQSRRAYAPE
jgi:hypothetical protein